MGTQKISMARDPESRKRFLQHILHDIEAVERMEAEGMFETGVTRIGAEQEFCLIDKYCKPSRHGLEVLQRVDDPHFNSELARYNLEINLDPVELRGACFKQVETQLRDLLDHAEHAAAEIGERILLTGILPSIDLRAVQMSYITPRPRYRALADVISGIRGQDFELNINGVDELILRHGNIMFEACNTSFQCHYQIQPDAFADSYNWAQMVSGPVLSVCANSPLLLGRQLWAETRIALFQQSIDTRGTGLHLREKEQRVTFGNRWIEGISDVYRNDVARYTLFFLTDIETNSLDVLDAGGIPSLAALQLHNGTIYKWNRPCYGVTDGVPHLRIENRYLPSGPTVADEMANFMFWTGLMSNLPDGFRGRWAEHSFADAKENFYKAAMWGVQSGMVWEGEMVPARTLVLDTLLPLAREGLEKVGIDAEDIDRGLGVIRRRAEGHATGARWLVKGFRTLREGCSREETVVALTALLDKRRRGGRPVHEWEPADASELDELEFQYDVVGNVMSTDLVTVSDGDLAVLVRRVMEWRGIHHILVEDLRGELQGLITRKHLDRMLARPDFDPLAVAADVMVSDPVTITPDADIKFAMLLMVDKAVSCLPVVEGKQLIGIITSHDTQEIWRKMNRKGTGGRA